MSQFAHQLSNSYLNLPTDCWVPSTSRIQVYITRDDICPDENKDLYNVVFKRLLDLGDFVGIEGFVFRTQMGEISIHAQKLTVLSKSIRPLPIVKYKDGVAYDKFEDPELRYRQRYVDLVVNDGVKEIFLKRNKVYNSMREYFNSKGYIEVETPILQSIAGGAAARPFITHHNALDIPLYMRIASELYLKRLIVGGFEGVYEIGKNFLDYCREGFYDNTIFHRVINGFMIQGGGFEPGMKQKATKEAIKNEANNGLKNTRGTLAMARTQAPHSATAQFFINVADNDFLNFSGESLQGWGYCVFAEVVEGMDVVDKIKAVSTGRSGMHQDVPKEDVVITSVTVSE